MGPWSHSNNPYLQEQLDGLGVLAQRDSVSILHRVSKQRVEARPPDRGTAERLGGVENRNISEPGGDPPQTPEGAGSPSMRAARFSPP
jgi:hypothetical protein